MAARIAPAADTGNRAAGQRPGFRDSGHRRPKRLRVLRGFRPARLRSGRERAVAHTAGTVQQSFRPWRLADPRRRHAAHELRSGYRLVPAGRRQEERPRAVANGASARPARLRDAGALSTAGRRCAGAGGRLLPALRLRPADRQGSLVGARPALAGQTDTGCGG